MLQTSPFPVSTPEAQGLPSAALLTFLDAIERQGIELHSLMVLRRGHLLAQGWWAPYRPDAPHMLFSLSKSFTSTAVGLAVSEGLLTIDDSVLSFFPDQAPPEPSANLAAMRVRHLLTMSAGHAEESLNRVARQGESDWVRVALSRPVPYAPGTQFVYNSGATYLLSAIVQKLTGQTLLDYLQPRLFGPLGIVGPVWESCPRGINTGGWGLNITTADIARFGQLYLQQGRWEGRQLVPADWVAAATSKQISNDQGPTTDWAQGYGYQFWRCQHGAYRGDGAFGQFCLVLPEQEAVIAITSGVAELQPVLTNVWEHILPALGSSALPPDPAANEALIERLAALTLPPVTGALPSALAAQLSGRTFAIAANPQGLATVRFDFAADRGTLTLVNAQGTHTLTAGNGVWVDGTTSYDEGLARPVAATGAWTDEHTYVLRLRYTATPFGMTLTSRFADDGVTIEQRVNVAFEMPTPPIFEGRLV